MKLRFALRHAPWAGVRRGGVLVTAAVAGVIGLVLGLLAPVHAQSASALRASARQIAAEIAAQKRAGRFDTAAQERAVQRLGKLALGYVALSERTANAGKQRGERQVFEAISTPLDDIYNANNAKIERMTRRIMDEDGDLEALYETQPFKDAQLVASHALYFRNWLNYYGARLYRGAQRRALLEKAQRGFSEFAVGERHTALLVESLLGRGLCNLELGHSDYAIHDLRAVAQDPQASKERKAKARLALLDAYVRTGKVSRALRLSSELLGTGGRAEDNLIRFLRIRALLTGARTASGATAARYRREALTLMDRLRRAGAGWKKKVSALAATSIEHPEQWSRSANNPFARWELAKLLVRKGDYARATPLLEGFVRSRDAQMRRYRGEAHYFLGLAKFRAGQYQEAAQQLDAALKAHRPSYGADAAYLRFKALEAVMAKHPRAAPSAQYEHAIRDYLTRYPTHKSAFEAYFRLGELLQTQGKFAAALEAYANVHGDPGFELRARFAGLQCDFELLQARDGRVPDKRNALLRAIGTSLQEFDKHATAAEKRTKSTDHGALSQMRAKVAVMQAVYLSLQPEPNQSAILKALDAFERKYPHQTDLLPQVARFRLAAYRHLGRFADAEAEVKAHGQLLLSSLGPRAVEDFAVSFIREGARRNGRGDAAANQAAQQVALRLYELLVSEQEDSGRAKLTLARLYENTGALKKAAALYAERLQSHPKSLAALRGLGRIAESQRRFAEAMGYWRRLGKAVRPGDAPWYEASYQVARLTQVLGKKDASCQQLTQLKPAMPGLSDADLRNKLDELYQQVCR
ncbi:MAG: hypothetical protein ACE5I7_12795 [Candidatus Binatia bacterium]